MEWNRVLKKKYAIKNKYYHRRFFLLFWVPVFKKKFSFWFFTNFLKKFFCLETVLEEIIKNILQLQPCNKNFVTVDNWIYVLWMKMFRSKIIRSLECEKEDRGYFTLINSVFQILIRIVCFHVIDKVNLLTLLN